MRSRKDNITKTRQTRQPEKRQQCVGTGYMDAAIARRRRWQ